MENRDGLAPPALLALDDDLLVAKSTCLTLASRKVVTALKASDTIAFASLGLDRQGHDPCVAEPVAEAERSHAADRPSEGLDQPRLRHRDIPASRRRRPFHARALAGSPVAARRREDSRSRRTGRRPPPEPRPRRDGRAPGVLRTPASRRTVPQRQHGDVLAERSRSEEIRERRCCSSRPSCRGSRHRTARRPPTRWPGAPRTPRPGS